ncbi:MAG TPA: Gfo/Idh/MocA family oxidoreductase, partial [Acidimicrobiales bacterium]|nr:Gfo/Idh/MocA family oxidoreductase [Acidimicrobiales bacterium]
VRVGIVGAGPWVKGAHAPVFAAGPETTLHAVWARRPEAAAAIADRYGATVAGSLDELADVSDVVVFAVPPAVQAELASRVARRSRPLLLEKPLAEDLAGAERLAEAVADAGVATMVTLSWRYSEGVRRFLDEASSFGATGGWGQFVSGALLGGPYATPWRLEKGALLDLGPHVLDLLDAALGPVTAVRAAGDSLRWLALTLEHEGGAVSQASLSASVPLSPHRAGVELFGPGGGLGVDCVATVGPEAFTTLRREVAAMARGAGPHPLDISRGLHLQRILEEAARQLA